MDAAQGPANPAMPLEDFLLSLSGGMRNTVQRRFNDINSTFQALVEQVGDIRDVLPHVMSKLESIKDSLDKWHRGTNLAVASGSTASAIGIMFGILSAPATMGASVAFGVGIAGSLTALGGMAVDEYNQHVSRNDCNNVVEELEKLCRKAESTYREFRENSEKLRRLLHNFDPSFINLNENDVYELSISFACSRLAPYEGTSTKRPRYISASASAALKPFQSYNALSKSSRTAVTTIRAFYRTATTATVKNSGAVARSVSTIAIRNPIVTNSAGFTVIEHGSRTYTAVNQGAKIMETTTSVNKVAGVVIEAGDVTVTKVSQLQAYVTTTTKEFAPIFSKAGFFFTAMGVVFDVYTAFKTFSDLINDEKCSASKQIADHIEQLKEMKEQVAQIFDYIQGIEDENRLLEN